MAIEAEFTFGGQTFKATLEALQDTRAPKWNPGLGVIGGPRRTFAEQVTDAVVFWLRKHEQIADAPIMNPRPGPHPPELRPHLRHSAQPGRGRVGKDWAAAGRRKRKAHGHHAACRAHQPAVYRR